MATIRERLDERINAELNEIEATEEAAERQTLYKNLESLLRMSNDRDAANEKYAADLAREKRDADREELEREKFEHEKELAERELEVRQQIEKSEQMGRLIGTVGGLAVSLVGFAFYSHWYKMGLQFEQEGTFCSSLVRSLFTKTPPKVG